MAAMGASMLMKQAPRALAAVFILLAMSAEASAAQASRAPRQWRCEGVARGANGSSVKVFWYVEAHRVVVGRFAAWTPPATVLTAPPRDLPGVSSDFEVLFSSPDDDHIGPAGPISVHLSGPRSIEGAAVTLEADDHRIWRPPLTPFSPDEAPPALNSLFLEADFDEETSAVEFAAGGTGVATFLDRAGRPLSQIRYDFAAQADRDRLYQRAAVRVRHRARRFWRCNKTVENIGLPPPVIPIH
jgi:hypothetical protein